ncbi:MAG: hypothetical protein M1820_006562 [Bogoriella megaspora]|nr:MAG: hypothetical protein M1820_006562 [Bogoriella megaspora]
MALTSLPLEIIDLILAHLWFPWDVLHLSLTCRLLSHSAEPYLYRNIEFLPRKDGNILRSFTSLLLAKPTIAKYVRRFEDTSQSLHAWNIPWKPSFNEDKCVERFGQAVSAFDIHEQDHLSWIRDFWATASSEGFEMYSGSQTIRSYSIKRDPEHGLFFALFTKLQELRVFYYRGDNYFRRALAGASKSIAPFQTSFQHLRNVHLYSNDVEDPIPFEDVWQLFTLSTIRQIILEIFSAVDPTADFLEPNSSLVETLQLIRANSLPDSLDHILRACSKLRRLEYDHVEVSGAQEPWDRERFNASLLHVSASLETFRLSFTDYGVYEIGSFILDSFAAFGSLKHIDTTVDALFPLDAAHHSWTMLFPCPEKCAETVEAASKWAKQMPPVLETLYISQFDGDTMASLIAVTYLCELIRLKPKNTPHLRKIALVDIVLPFDLIKGMCATSSKSSTPNSRGNGSQLFWATLTKLEIVDFDKLRYEASAVGVELIIQEKNIREDSSTPSLERDCPERDSPGLQRNRKEQDTFTGSLQR